MTVWGWIQVQKCCCSRTQHFWVAEPRNRWGLEAKGGAGKKIILEMRRILVLSHGGIHCSVECRKRPGKEEEKSTMRNKAMQAGGSYSPKALSCCQISKTLLKGCSEQADFKRNCPLIQRQKWDYFLCPILLGACQTVNEIFKSTSHRPILLSLKVGDFVRKWYKTRIKPVAHTLITSALHCWFHTKKPSHWVFLCHFARQKSLICLRAQD